MTVHGLLLAAGAGTRYGGPKALVEGWLLASVTILYDGGCDQVSIVLGAEADRAAELVPATVTVVIADDWADGMGSSLRAGLSTLAEGGGTDEAALVHLVDLSDVGPDVVRRLLAAVEGPASLARATYAGRPGHPVLLGREHWAGVIASARGDRGARDYLRAHPPDDVECGDLATGRDVDRPTNGSAR